MSKSQRQELDVPDKVSQGAGKIMRCEGDVCAEIREVERRTCGTADPGIFSLIYI